MGSRDRKEDQRGWSTVSKWENRGRQVEVVGGDLITQGFVEFI